jgi:anti-sigma factor RsiW
MQQEEIEIQLWEYIDGNCTAGEQARISGLIATDSHWKACYEDLLSFQHSVQADAVPELTTANFTENVMSVLDASASRLAARKRMLTLSIRIIAAFFIVSIGLLLSYALVDAGGVSFSPSEYQLPDIQLPQVHLPTYAPFIAGLLAVIMLLAAGDNILRGKTTHRA